MSVCYLSYWRKLSIGLKFWILWILCSKSSTIPSTLLFGIDPGGRKGHAPGQLYKGQKRTGICQDPVWEATREDSGEVDQCVDEDQGVGCGLVEVGQRCKERGGRWGGGGYRGWGWPLGRACGGREERGTIGRGRRREVGEGKRLNLHLYHGGEEEEGRLKGRRLTDS